MTLRKRNPTFDLLNRILTWGNPLGSVLSLTPWTEVKACPLRLRLNIAGETSMHSAFPFPHYGGLLGAGYKSNKHSRICAPKVMTENKRTQAAIPHQDTRNLSCPAWFSTPRGTTCSKKFRREKNDMRRIGHGSARAIENMRRVWLPLVSGPDSKDSLLRTM